MIYRKRAFRSMLIKISFFFILRFISLNIPLTHDRYLNLFFLEIAEYCTFFYNTRQKIL